MLLFKHIDITTNAQTTQCNGVGTIFFVVCIDSCKLVWKRERERDWMTLLFYEFAFQQTIEFIDLNKYKLKLKNNVQGFYFDDN